MRDPQAEPSDLIRSVSRAFQVLEAVGQSPRGLTVKQIARRCDLTVATTYHLVRTLAYEGYVMRREDGTYIVGLEVADRFRELVQACRGPQQVQDVLRRAATDTGFTHMIGRIINNRVAVVAVAEGVRSPYCEDLVVGYDDGAHATALGKALLAFAPSKVVRMVLTPALQAYTTATLTTPEQLHRALQCVRLHGMATSRGELQAGHCGVAVPVLGPCETAIAAVEVEVADLETATLGRVVPALVLAARGLARELAVDPRERATAAVGAAGSGRAAG